MTKRYTWQVTMTVEDEPDFAAQIENHNAAVEKGMAVGIIDETPEEWTWDTLMIVASEEIVYEGAFEVEAI